MTRWILIADVGRACIFGGNSLHGYMRLLRRIANPKGRAHRETLGATAPGRVRKSVGNVYSSINWRTDPHEIETKRFAQRLAKLLERERVHDRYGELAIVAPPHFLGALRNLIGVHTADALRDCVPQDCSKFRIRELDKHLKMILPDFMRAEASLVEAVKSATTPDRK